MSFSESVFSAEFNQKTVKEDLFVKRNHEIPPRNRCGKTLEDSRRRITKAGHVALTCGSTRPHLEAAQPLWAPPVGCLAPRPTYQPPRRNVDSPPPPRLHLRHPLSWFNPRAQDWCSFLYISAPTTPLRHPQLISHLRRQKP